MRVTEDMTDEPGGTPLLELADFLGADEAGVKVTQDGEQVRLKVDSTAYPSKSVWLDLDDAEGLAFLILQKAAEARAALNGKPAPLVTFRRELSPGLAFVLGPEGAAVECGSLRAAVPDVAAARRALDDVRDFQLINDAAAVLPRQEGTSRP